jgi:SAM-dependent methyltransferase
VDYDASTYGDRYAEVYDDWFGGDGADVAATLAELAGAGPALELGIGTGRIALPLAERGIEVHGIDASEAMVAKLREKLGGERIRVTMGDFADVGVDGTYALVFVVFNTIFALRTQDDQLRCFANVRERLAQDGVFAIEAFVPDLTRFDRGQRFAVTGVDSDSVRIEAARHDPVAQTVHSQTTELREGGARFHPIRLRYAWPSELDLMARLAGLRLRERWGGWRKEPFTEESGKHVSLYDPG